MLVAPAIAQCEKCGAPAGGAKVPEATPDDPALDEEAPLADVADRMGTVAERLDKKDTCEKVQVRQRQIVGRLDELIERLRKKQRGGGG